MLLRQAQSSARLGSHAMTHFWSSANSLDVVFPAPPPRFSQLGLPNAAFRYLATDPARGGQTLYTDLRSGDQLLANRSFRRTQTLNDMADGKCCFRFSGSFDSNSVPQNLKMLISHCFFFVSGNLPIELLKILNKIYSNRLIQSNRFATNYQ